MAIQNIQNDIFDISTYDATVPMEWMQKLLRIKVSPAITTGLALWFFAKRLGTCEFAVSRKMIGDLFNYSRSSPLKGLRALNEHGLINLKLQGKGKPNYVEIINLDGEIYSDGAFKYLPSIDNTPLARLKYYQQFRVKTSSGKSTYAIKNPGIKSNHQNNLSKTHAHRDTTAKQTSLQQEKELNQLRQKQKRLKKQVYQFNQSSYLKELKEVEREISKLTSTNNLNN